MKKIGLCLLLSVGVVELQASGNPIQELRKPTSRKPTPEERDNRSIEDKIQMNNYSLQRYEKFMTSKFQDGRKSDAQLHKWLSIIDIFHAQIVKENNKLQQDLQKQQEARLDKAMEILGEQIAQGLGLDLDF